MAIIAFGHCQADQAESGEPAKVVDGWRPPCIPRDIPLGVSLGVLGTVLVPAASSSARPRPAGDVDGDDGCSTDAGGHGEDDDACPDYPGVPDRDAGEPAHGADEAHGAHQTIPPRITRSFHLLDMISSPVWLDIKVVNKNSTEFLRLRPQLIFYGSGACQPVPVKGSGS